MTNDCDMGGLVRGHRLLNSVENILRGARMLIAETRMDFDVRAQSREQGRVELPKEDVSVSKVGFPDAIFSMRTPSHGKNLQFAGVSSLMRHDNSAQGWIISNVPCREYFTVKYVTIQFKLGPTELNV